MLVVARLFRGGDALLNAALVLFVMMSVVAGVGGALWFGITTALQYGFSAAFSNAMLGVIVLVHQLIPALIVVVLLFVSARRSWRLGYFVGPVAVAVAASAYCGAFYLIGTSNTDDAFGPVIGSAFLTIGLPLLIATHCLALLLSGLLFRRSPEMQRLLGRRDRTV